MQAKGANVLADNSCNVWLSLGRSRCRCLKNPNLFILSENRVNCYETKRIPTTLKKTLKFVIAIEDMEWKSSFSPGQRNQILSPLATSFAGVKKQNVALRICVDSRLSRWSKQLRSPVSKGVKAAVVPVSLLAAQSSPLAADVKSDHGRRPVADQQTVC
jgi:hypothetical protein